VAPAGRVRLSHHEWGTLVLLSAPAVRNALDAAAVRDLATAFADDRPGAVVLAGEGAAFCSGGDVTALRAASTGGDLSGLLAGAGREFTALVEQVVRCPRPVVAAVRGAAVGGGLCLALACDVRIAGRSTRLVPGWGRWGLPPDGGATALLASAVGPVAAAGALITADDLTPDSPLAPLLFAEVVDDDQVLPTAVALAQRLAASPGARAAKAVTRELLLPLLRAQGERELAAMQQAAGEPAVAALLAAAR
jgi:2-(1,2-epoxy-1,2-dihydrophenyl)acetyl-CoA isomerase